MPTVILDNSMSHKNNPGIIRLCCNALTAYFKVGMAKIGGDEVQLGDTINVR
jgi:hypothetical protein